MVKSQPKAKVRKKVWYPIHAPKEFREAVLGETVVYTPDQMLGKRVTANLMNLTNDIKKQNITLTFEVSDVKDDKGATSIVGYKMVPNSVKRMVRRRSDKIGMSFTAETSDNKLVRLKPLLVTRGNTTGVVKNKIRQTVLSHIVHTVKKMNYDALVNDLINHKFQQDMKGRLSKLHPMKLCEISSLGLTKAKQ